MIEVFKMDIRTENKINLKAWLEALGMKEIPDEKNHVRDQESRTDDNISCFAEGYIQDHGAVRAQT